MEGFIINPDLRAASESVSVYKFMIPQTASLADQQRMSGRM